VKSTIKGPLADSIDRYLAHKRSLGKQLDSAGLMLHVLDNYLNTQEIVEAHQITSAHLAGFVASRHRNSARSYNELIGTIRGLMNWMVVHELLPESPLKCETRQVPPPRRPFLFNSDQARRIFEVAERLPSTSRAQNPGGIYRMIFVLLYGLGLRVDEVSRLCRKHIDLDNQLLMIRQTKFGKDWSHSGQGWASRLQNFWIVKERALGRFRPTARCLHLTSRNGRRLARTLLLGHSINCCPAFS
jgi:site-specific recombinase XerD